MTPKLISLLVLRIFIYIIKALCYIFEQKKMVKFFEVVLVITGTILIFNYLKVLPYLG